jgi:hypothetical protein
MRFLDHTFSRLLLEVEFGIVVNKNVKEKGYGFRALAAAPGLAEVRANIR